MFSATSEKGSHDSNQCIIYIFNGITLLANKNKNVFKISETQCAAVLIRYAHLKILA